MHITLGVLLAAPAAQTSLCSSLSPSRAGACPGGHFRSRAHLLAAPSLCSPPSSIRTAAWEGKVQFQLTLSLSSLQWLSHQVCASLGLFGQGEEQ